LAAGDPRLPELRTQAGGLKPLLALGVAPAPDAAARCFPDLGHDRVACLEPEPGALREALARLLDAQHHPRLARLAPELTGDPGVALRALLAARAVAAAAGGLGPPLPREPAGILSEETLELERGGSPDAFLQVAARIFLRAQHNPERPLREPPLSTRQLLSPRDYAAGVRPVRLAGAAPALPGCEPAADESVGVARLLAAAARAGGALPARPLARWSGDRAVVLACPDGRRPWLYVAALEDAGSVDTFAAHAERLLPAELPRPFESARLGRRFAAWHEVSAGPARAFAESQAAEELRALPQPP
jgi:hypothetical protein